MHPVAFRDKKKKNERPAASSRAREEAVEASDSFFQKEETDEEDAWAAFSRRKKREERMLGPLFPKGRNERRGCLDYSTKKVGLSHQKGLKGMEGCA